MTNIWIYSYVFHGKRYTNGFYKLFWAILWIVLVQRAQLGPQKSGDLQKIMRASHLLQMGRGNILVSPRGSDIFMPHHGLDEF